jgi:hypothetical protein
MIKTILGLLAGACANAGKVNAGKLNAAKATLETSRFPIFRLIFMIPDPPLRILIGYWASSQVAVCRMKKYVIALRPPPKVVRFFIDPAIFRRLLCSRYAISAEMF